MYAALIERYARMKTDLCRTRGTLLAIASRALNGGDFEISTIRQAFITIILFCLVLVACGCDKVDGPSEVGIQFHRLIYSAGGRIVIISTEAGVKETISDGESIDSGPQPSPDGRSIAFYSRFGSNPAIGLCLMDPEGGKKIRLTDIAYEGQWATHDVMWAADGSSLVYSAPKSGSDHIYAYRLAINREEKLTALGYNTQPKLSPDGQMIAYVSEERGDNRPSAIYIMEGNGGNEHPLLPQGHTTAAYWSHDSKRILFGGNLGYLELPHYENYRKTNVFVTNVDQSGLVQLTSDSSSAPMGWSPDETKILFASWRDWLDGIHSDVYVMNSDGSHVQRLTMSGYANSAVWSPDGRYIAYLEYLQNPFRFGIFVMDVDGSNKRLLVESTTISSDPVWMP
jgi:Tol biopolymer transport system component